jgi:preprotein translocase subunit SecD
MKTSRRYINIILLLAGFLAGCESSKDKDKEFTLIKLHAETTYSGSEFSKTVPVFRASPTYVTIDRNSFLDENDLVRASIEEDNGFAIRLQFNEHGVLLLENVTRANQGGRIAIFCDFGEQSRWLAAPVFDRAVTDGIITFTPDATREETERIVRGLNNEVKVLKKKDD